jgi:nitrogen fixation/metabolism regulation signal transduction histidine kinase
MKTLVLLVDDEEQFVDALSERLAIRDYDITTSLSGDNALEKIRQYNYDVTILDVAMPRADGFELKLGCVGFYMKILENCLTIKLFKIPFIFEPFFSSKVDRGRTGLGLAVTHHLVREIGGRISVESRVGEGTCFTVVLPVNTKSRENSQHARTNGR